MTDEHICYNALALRSPGNYHRLRKLFRIHGSWRAAYRSEKGPDDADPDKAYKALGSHGIRLLLNTDPDFPPLLREMPWAPHAIYLRGAPVGPEPKIAIVGTRRATSLGTTTAEALARDLARAGVTIVSGLAFGIDVAAHRATLACSGKAVAVLASGLDIITPTSNRHVGEQIISSGGTLISEYPIGTTTLPSFFVARNRIVSGLCRGIVVIEAPARSGTLSTARFATDQNREVFVVPGAVNHPNYEGSHALIKSGVALITGARDVLEALELTPPETAAPGHTQALPFLDGDARRIVELLSAAGTPLAADTIAERLKLGASIINEALGLLVIEGVITEDDHGYRIA